MSLWGLELNWQSVLWGLAVFALSMVLSFALLAAVLIQLPANYFQGAKPPPLWGARHPLLRLLGRIAKNLLGAVLVVVGIVLSLPGVPGQGLLTILVGIVLLDLPGKRRVEQRIVRRRRIFQAMNWLRSRFGRPRMVLDDEHDAG